MQLASYLAPVIQRHYGAVTPDWLTNYLNITAAKRSCVYSNATANEYAVREIPIINEFLRNLVVITDPINSGSLRACLTDSTALLPWLLDFEKYVIPFLKYHNL